VIVALQKPTNHLHMNRFEGGPPEFSSTPETSQEKESFEPNIIFDFIRHGEAEYSDEQKQQVEDLGYSYDELLPSEKITTELRGTRAGKEGRLTQEGKAQLIVSMEHLVEKIDPDNEVVMVLSSPRLRAEESAGVIVNALAHHGIDVQGARECLDLVDMKKPWIGILEFLKQSSSGEQSPFQYWLKMSEEELQKADVEGMENIEDRTDHFMRLIQRFAKTKQQEWGLDKKILRVIAVTHDINLIAAANREHLSPKEINDIKNAEILELGVDNQGNTKLLADNGAV